MQERSIPSILFPLSLIVNLLVVAEPSLAQFPRFKALAFYSTKVEQAHVVFAQDAIQFFKELTVGNGFVFDVTDTMSDLNEEKLKDYSVFTLVAFSGH